MNFNCQDKFPSKAYIKISWRLSKTSEVLMTSLLDFCFLTCICMFAGYNITNSGSVLEQSISSFISKCSALFELLESLLTTKSPDGLRASQLVVLFFQNSGGCLEKQPLHPQSSKLWGTLQMNPFFKSSGSFVNAN